MAQAGRADPAAHPAPGTIRYPEDLPVSARREDIAAVIRDHQVVVVAGETGSGKTTQLPKICLDLGRGSERRIGHTQPRRIAARSVAERISAELAGPDGGLADVVGYQVRFTDRTGPASRVKLMTDGILLAELQHDPDLAAYDTVIIDEAHERSLNIDFILGYLHRLLPRRPDLKLVITSATIDPERFARHFADAQGEPAPVVEVSGRTYPVEVRYRPLVEESPGGVDDEGEQVVRDQTEAVLDAVDELVAEGPGDVLVFLPGEREIRDTAEALAEHARQLDVVPLFARLSAAEQHRVFAEHSRRRVVLATNIAETSLTVPGIRYVVDTGLARISRYSHRSKVQRLPVEPVSRASADQRAGRCGRVEAGVCVRLYSEEGYASRPAFTDPEILRTSLASVILQMASLGLGEVSRFGFVDPPDSRQVKAGVQLLEELGALARPSQGGHRVTRLGRTLARIPLDPRLARMLVEADRLGCVNEVLVIVAALSIQDPRERPAEQRAQADQQHARFHDPTSDFLTLLNLWRHLREQQRHTGSSAFRRGCRAEYLNYVRIREWQDFEAQLRRVARRLGMNVPRSRGPRAEAAEPDTDGIHQALLSGLLSHIGVRDPEQRDYLGARGTRFAIFPGSGLFKKQPQTVMAAELVETSRLWARQNAAIRPEWAERMGGHLVRRSHSEPHWSKKRAAVMAYERVTLYGVPLVADRLVNYAPVDPVLSRELFIRHALVYGQWRTRHGFLARNRAMLDEAEDLENRVRRRDIVVDEHTLFDFYDARVGEEVVSGAHFDTWWKRARRDDPELLTFDPAMLVNDAAGEVSRVDFPDSWHEGGLSLPIRYHFDPGHAEDGLTIEVPVDTLDRVAADRFAWLVPGMREELVVALLRSLPKRLRVSFVPAPDHARGFLAAVAVGQEPLLDALERHLRATTGVSVDREDWDWTKVPAHLRPTFRLLDEQGEQVGAGKDLAALTRPLAPGVAETETAAGDEGALTRTGRRAWAFGTITQRLRVARAGHEVHGYPALVDELSRTGELTVGLVVLGGEAEQHASHRRGLRRLVLLAVDSPARAISRGLGNAERLTLSAADAPSPVAVVEDCVAAAVDALVAEHAGPDGLVWDEASFDALVAAVRPRLDEATRAVLREAVGVLEAWRATERGLSGSVPMSLLSARSDMSAQVARLVHRGFVAETGAGQLGHLRRYLRAVDLRRDGLADGSLSVGRDRQLMDQVSDLERAHLDRVSALPEGQPPGPGLVRVRWMLEELRVSLWAQRLGTAYPVSAQRVRAALEQS